MADLLDPEQHLEREQARSAFEELSSVLHSFMFSSNWWPSTRDREVVVTDIDQVVKTRPQIMLMIVV